MDTPRDDQMPIDRDIEKVSEQRKLLQARHSQALANLMEHRRDLRGVHPLADLVDDAVRWSA